MVDDLHKFSLELKMLTNIFSVFRDDLNLEDARVHGSDDQWFSKEKLYKVNYRVVFIFTRT